jgi:glutamyl-tRNA synthetase
MNKDIIQKLFPDELPSIEAIEQKFPPRKLAADAMVTRVAPSPTGFMHIGTLYTSLICERLAHQSNQGVFILRIEDTDKKREIAGAGELVVKTLSEYGITVDEGPTLTGDEVGSYGPYTQSARADYYMAFVKLLVEKGEAYPCFFTQEEMEALRKKQESLKIRPGYFGPWAKWRDAPEENILTELEKGTPFVIRFRSSGDYSTRRIQFVDLLKGDMNLPENDLDIVLIKSDGLPMYHLAHIIDDHFMGTTHVIRGDEWLASVPLHLQLFKSFAWTPPHYAHLAPIQKMDGSSKRKLSKRKDPEASMSFYQEQGYPKSAVLDYLINLANSNFEDWRKVNLDQPISAFPLTLDKLANSSGALFDFVKLGNISKEIIAQYPAQKVYDEALAWVNQYDQPLAELMTRYAEYTLQILAIERNTTGKTRKDIAKWSDLRAEVAYFYDECFSYTKEELLALLAGISIEDMKSIILSFHSSYDRADSKEQWFEKMKVVTKENNFAENVKDFKADKAKYKGSIVDVTKIFRVLLTGKAQTPDLHELMLVMGTERIVKRLSIL